MLLMIQMEYVTLPKPTIPRTDTTMYTHVSINRASDDMQAYSKICTKCVSLLHFHSVDHSRVILSIPDERGSDYINASYINVSFSMDMLSKQQGATNACIAISQAHFMQFYFCGYSTG